MNKQITPPEGWTSVATPPKEGAEVETLYYWIGGSEPRIINGTARYFNRSYRDNQGGCLDTPSWWRYRA